MKVLIHLSLIVLIGKAACVPLVKWQKTSDGCPYFIEHGQYSNWFQAWEECLQKNMTLLAIDSLYKQQQIDGLVQQLFPKNLTYWLASHDFAVEKRHVWVNTGKEMGYTNWYSDQPNWLTDDHCVSVDKSNNQWYDSSCKSKYGYICEIMQCSDDKTPDTDVTWSKVSRKYNVQLWNVIANP